MKNFLFSFFLIVGFSGFSQDNPLTPEDVAKIQQVGTAVITPDGNHVYYTVVVPADPFKENAPATSHLYRYDVASKSHTPLITQHSSGNLAVRPGTKAITFTAKPENADNTGIYQLSPDDEAPQLLVSHETSISGFSWNKDGRNLAFIARSASDKEAESLPYQPEVYEENLPLNAGFISDVETGDASRLRISGHVTAIEWSPDGGQMAVRTAPSPMVDDFYTSQKIYILNTIDQSISATVDHKAKMGQMQWSPNGKRIGLIAGADQHDPTDGRLLVASNSGGQATIAAEEFPGAFHQLHWQDNNTITFLASMGVGSAVGNISVNGAFTEIFRSETMAITRFSMSDNGTIVAVASSPSHPAELFFIENSNKAERLTDLNPWLAEKSMGKQEIVTYTTKDGTEIQGVLMLPQGGETNPPMITVVHGGPEAHYDNGWLTGYSMPGQMATAKGYAVFYPNYRGSTGRGLEFAMSSQGDPAGAEFDDIIEGIDYLAENYNIDKDRVGVTGGSYGGYATAWMSTRHTERFAAGVMFVGISNNLSKWGTSDIPEEMFLVHSRKRIWDDYEFFLERSPITYAGQAKTPLLIMHGKNDTRVDPGQSYELYRHIKTRTDTPVRLVLYPGEGHGNRKSTARYDYSLRMMRWFDHYLMDKKTDLPAAEMDKIATEIKN